MWRTTTIGAGKFAGNPRATRWSASTPPADAPMTTSRSCPPPSSRSTAGSAGTSGTARASRGSSAAAIGHTIGTPRPRSRQRPPARVAAARQFCVGSRGRHGHVTEADDAISQLVVIGSSAGGIDALSTIARTLPADLPAPILVAQHLDPRRPSHLTDILRRQTSLRVETVEDHARLEAGTILVLPPGRQAEITDHEVRLSDTTERGPRPSIDVLFSSAAQVFGEGVIAVILTGTGHDGAAGARDVKAMGGTVVVQNPETASYPGMPLSLAPTSIDIVAELEAIGGLIHELLTGVREPDKPDDERLLRAFLDQLRDRSGIDFAGYKRATILRRLQRRMVATSNPKLRSYVRYVQ